MIGKAKVSNSGRDKTNPSTKLLLWGVGLGFVFKREKESSGICSSGPLKRYVILPGGFCISPTRRKLVFLRALEISELCCHTLYPRHKAASPFFSENPTDHCQHGHTVGWASWERRERM